MHSFHVNQNLKGLPQVHCRGFRKQLVIYFLFVSRGALLAFFVLTGWAQAQNIPVFVLNSLDGNVSVIDPVTWTETQRIPTGKEPHHLYLTPDEKSVIVANALSDSLTFIDPRTANAACNAGGKLLKVVEMQHKYGKKPVKRERESDALQLI
jgi:YVTN family beta-propeller protein